MTFSRLTTVKHRTRDVAVENMDSHEVWCIFESLGFDIEGLFHKYPR